MNKDKTHEIMFTANIEADMQPANPANRMERIKLKQGERMGVKCYPFVKSYDGGMYREMANLQMDAGCMLMAVPMKFFSFVETES